MRLSPTMPCAAMRATSSSSTGSSNCQSSLSLGYWLGGRIADRNPSARLLGRLGDIGCPTVVLWGERDALIPLSHGQAFAQAIPGARLRIVPGAGHLVALDRPDVFAAEVRSLPG
jgi:pimeloyl-ACP methyl ester carboxylesterase